MEYHLAVLQRVVIYSKSVEATGVPIALGRGALGGCHGRRKVRTGGSVARKDGGPYKTGIWIGGVAP